MIEKLDYNKQTEVVDILDEHGIMVTKINEIIDYLNREREERLEELTRPHLNAEKGERCPYMESKQSNYAGFCKLFNCKCDDKEDKSECPQNNGTGKSSAMGEDKEAKHYKLGTFKNILGRG